MPGSKQRGSGSSLWHFAQGCCGCKKYFWVQGETGGIHRKVVCQRLLNEEKPCLAQKVPKLEIVEGLGGSFVYNRPFLTLSSQLMETRSICNRLGMICCRKKREGSLPVPLCLVSTKRQNSYGSAGEHSFGDAATPLHPLIPRGASHTRSYLEDWCFQ